MIEEQQRIIANHAINLLSEIEIEGTVTLLKGNSVGVGIVSPDGKLRAAILVGSDPLCDAKRLVEFYKDEASRNLTSGVVL